MKKDLGQKERIRQIIPISTTYNLKYFLVPLRTKLKNSFEGVGEYYDSKLIKR